MVSPVYLDNEMMLDLLATAEDGFQLVQEVTGRSELTRSSQLAGEAAAGGGSGLLSMLKLDLSLGAKRERGSSEASEVTATRTHTYGSLLARLRRFLSETGQVRSLGTASDLEDLAPGSFVEVSGLLDANPFTGVFLQLGRTIDFVTVASALSSPDPSTGTKAERTAAAAAAKEERERVEGLKDFVESLARDVERDGIETVLLRPAELDVTVVATVVTDFLARRTISELVDRQFRVLGKVVRVERSNQVDLLGQSGVAGLGPGLLSILIGALDGISTEVAAGLRRPSPTIEPPVVEVLPVAIYA